MMLTLHSMLRDSGPKAERAFWKTMSGELFSNVKQLFTQIDCWDQEREPGDGTGAQLAVRPPLFDCSRVFDC